METKTLHPGPRQLEIRAPEPLSRADNLPKWCGASASRGVCHLSPEGLIGCKTAFWRFIEITVIFKNNNNSNNNKKSTCLLSQNTSYVGQTHPQAHRRSLLPFIYFVSNAYYYRKNKQLQNKYIVRCPSAVDYHRLLSTHTVSVLRHHLKSTPQVSSSEHYGVTCPLFIYLY